MAGSMRLWDGASGRFRGGEPSAKGRCLRSGKVERICLRFGDGPAGHDLVWHSRHSDVRAERSAVPEAVRMKNTCSSTTSVSSRGAQTPRDLALKFAATARGKQSTTQPRGTSAGSEET